jgi:hypothetical protein
MFRMVSVLAGLALITTGASVALADQVDILAVFGKAASEGRTGTAKKTRAVDSRPAKPGEIVITVIKDEGVETRSKPAETGDFVVRNRCPETGNEEYLVKAERFPERYRDPKLPAAPGGWREVHPVGVELSYCVFVGDAPVSFLAPWGEMMVARAGDVIVQDPNKPTDTYRVARASFLCTYEVVTPPRRESAIPK